MIAVTLRAGFHPARIRSMSVFRQSETTHALADSSPGNQRACCSGEPKEWIAWIASAPCTDANERTPESARSSSCMIRPYAV